MTLQPVERRWLIGAADEAAAARAWLKGHLSETSWRLELPGLEEEAARGGARIAVPCTFDREADAAFGDEARRILQGAAPISAGKLQFLDLEKVRAHFGDGWPKVASRAEALVRRAIERRLTPLDVYRKTTDLNFIAVFGCLSAREAEVKCALMSEEITRMLVGEDMGAGMLAVTTVAADIDGPATLRKVGPSDDVAQTIETAVETERLHRRAKTADLPSPEVAADPLANIQFAYRPIWDVKRSAVASFYLLPGHGKAGERWRHEVDRPGLDNIVLQRRFDDLVVRRAVADLMALQRQERRLVISFPVQFESISTPTRRGAVLEVWRRLGLETRRLGVFEIVGAPEGIPHGRLAEIVNHLKVDSRGVLVRVPLNTPSFRNFSDSGILAIGTELGVQSGSEERLMGAFREFVANAERARLTTYVHGLRSFSLTIGAIGAGFTFVDGDPVSSISDRPEDAYRFGLEDLYARRLGA